MRARAGATAAARLVAEAKAHADEIRGRDPFNKDRAATAAATRAEAEAVAAEAEARPSPVP